MPALKDLTGQRFGRLTVLSRDFSKKGVYWICKCDCGALTSIRSNNLTMGKTKSCGCLYQETRAAAGKIGGSNGFNDLTNKTFGHLTALYPLNDKRGSNGSIIWHCRCSCGNELDVSSTNLTREKITHCGCQTIVSKGEEKIAFLLSQNNVPFERQKIFLECKFDSGHPARFDFYVNNSYIIEFDGKQHTCIGGERFNKQRVDEIKLHDDIKNKWCKENNIPIIRIPYTHYKDLDIKDLLLETSDFVI